MKEKLPNVKVVIAEPEASAVLSGGEPGFHRIEGIGEGFIPDVLDTSLIDEIAKVADDDAIETSRRLAKEEGILSGISTGANVWASLKIAEKMDAGRIVTLMPDCALRYTADL